ncbi:20004_t:CDS:2, partial [Funneliformis geosporum]
AVVSVNQGYPRIAKRIHQTFGATLLLSACNPTFWNVAYSIWLFMLIITFFMGELWRRMEGVFKLCNIEGESKVDERKSMLHGYIDHENYNRLPEFTWEEINDRVQSGAFLVICDGLVIDIRKWIRIHPGENVIKEDVMTTDTPVLSTYRTNNINSSILKKYISILKGDGPTKGS